LHDPRVELESVLVKNQLDSKFLDMIFAGPIPPNPAELLSNGRFEALLNMLKEMYDYVIVDTAPTILVTDTLIISKLADVTLYVIRADYTDKKLLYYTMELKHDDKMNNMAYVFNNVGLQKSYGYGYKYGYSYGYRYNYGYGYGYGAEKAIEKVPFVKKIMKLLGLRK
jgi:Mrp family chromosome partitioning ATPase